MKHNKLKHASKRYLHDLAKEQLEYKKEQQEYFKKYYREITKNKLGQKTAEQNAEQKAKRAAYDKQRWLEKKKRKG